MEKQTAQQSILALETLHMLSEDYISHLFLVLAFATQNYISRERGSSKSGITMTSKS